MYVLGIKPTNGDSTLKPNSLHCFMDSLYCWVPMGEFPKKGECEGDCQFMYVLEENSSASSLQQDCATLIVKHGEEELKKREAKDFLFNESSPTSTMVAEAMKPW